MHQAPSEPDIFDEDDDYEWRDNLPSKAALASASQRYQGLLTIFYREARPLTYDEIYAAYTATIGPYFPARPGADDLAQSHDNYSVKIRNDIKILNEILGDIIVEDKRNNVGTEHRYLLRPDSRRPTLAFDAAESVWVHLALGLLEGDFTQIDSHVRSVSDIDPDNPLEVQSQVLISRLTQDIFHAIAAHQFIEFDYQARYGEYTHRRVRPTMMMLSRGFFYVRGFDETRQGFRTFKLSRLSNLVITDQTFEVAEFVESPRDVSLESPLDRIVFVADPEKASEAVMNAELICEYGDFARKGAELGLPALDWVRSGWNLYQAKQPDFYNWSRLAAETMTHLVVLDPPKLVTATVQAARSLTHLSLTQGESESGRLKFDDFTPRNTGVSIDNQTRVTTESLAVMTFIFNASKQGGTCTVDELAKHFGLKPQDIKNIIWDFLDLDAAASNEKSDYDSFLPSIRKDGTIEVNGSRSWVMPPSFSTDEALSLLLGLEVAGYLAPSSQEAIATARLKVASWLGQAHELTAPQLVTNTVPPSIQSSLETLNRAIERGHTVVFTYTNASWDTAERRVAPRSVYTDRYHVYLVGVNLEKNKWHKYRLDRLSDLRVTAETIPDKLPQKPSYKYQTVDLELKNQAKSYADTILHAQTVEQSATTYRVRLKVKDPAWLQRVLQILAPDIEAIIGGPAQEPVVAAAREVGAAALALYAQVDSAQSAADR
ncbi:WYL domain-containing protein [uncultured Mobiluncus sp.]|uniref:WYL domain-containing protein n=1 Tax=uncultured Mobiluncus sp. TaxID=293425 RepID=UPI0025EB684C|nr:WYL domain-containing protein [uncultured Mobiluncus sp.]